MVLFFHYVTAIGAPNHKLWGVVTVSTHLFWSGVDLFFVLSGFLIAGILLDSAKSQRYFQTFYARRVARIFPLYFFWLTLFYISIAVNLDEKLRTQIFAGSVPLWLYPLFLQNNAPLWLNAKLPLWMAMSWSLAVEEQFYLILPALIRFLRKSTLALLCCATLALSPVYRRLLVLSSPHLNDGWPFATPVRLDALAAGVCVALLLRNEKCWRFLVSHSHALRLVASFLFCGFILMTYWPLPLQWLDSISVFAALYAAVLLLATCEPGSLFAAFLRSPFLKYFGRISYAIYIFHQGVHGLIDRMLPLRTSGNALRTVAVVIISAAITMLLAELSWRIMESKLISRAHKNFTY